MGSTEIVNRTSAALEMKVGNCRCFVKMGTVGRNQSHTVHVSFDDTYMQYSLGEATGKTIIFTSDECVDNKKIIVREVDGEFHVDMEPRDAPPPTSAVVYSSITQPERLKKRPCTFWR